MQGAFQGSAAIKADILRRFDAALRSDATALPSLATRMVADGDVGTLAAELGFPKCLIAMLDGLLMTLEQIWFDDAAEVRHRADAIARRWIEVVTPGSDVSRVPGQLIDWILSDAADRVDLRQAEPRLDTLRHRLVDLHARAGRGERIPRQDWAALRSESVALNDSLARGPARWVGFAIEAAAWDPRTSGNVLFDLVRATNEIHNRHASQATGWTPGDMERAQAVLQGILENTRVQREKGEVVKVPELFAAAEPELEERFRIQINAGSRASFAYYEKLLQVVADELAAAATGPAIIPRAHLFGNPVRVGNQISPDGRWLTWHAPLAGVMNLWIAPRESPDQGIALTTDTGRGIRAHHWAFDSRHILFAQDRMGNEKSQVYACDISDRSVRPLTAAPEATCFIARLSRRYPEKALIASNERDLRYHDLYLYDIATGERDLIERNEGYAFYLTDEEFQPRVAAKSLHDGGTIVLRREANGSWAEWIGLSAEDAATSGPLHLSEDAQTLYFADSRGREATALVAIDLATSQVRVLADDPRGPVGIALVDLQTYAPTAWSILLERRELHLIDEQLRTDVHQIEALGCADWNLTSRSLDDRYWVVGASSDVDAGAAYLYDRRTHSIVKLGESRPALKDAVLSRMHPATIRARDGLPLVCYLTLPAQFDLTASGTAPQSSRRLPMVLEVHGGPAMRDVFGFNPWHQWLANRGYAVLSVNFRGSSGFTKSFLAAGDGQWGAKMSDDLDDAVAWAVALDVAEPTRVAIEGASYGGYAVLAALTRTPSAYACGIDLVGPSNLQTLMGAIPPYWEAHRARLYRQVGDPRTEDGLALLRSRSPLHRARDIASPLLIGQGAHDPRVLRQEADQMVDAMVINGVPVTYLLYPDEGHGFGRAANAISFSAASEAFLAQHLGGRFEPLSAAEVAGASMEIVVGGEWVRELWSKAVSDSRT